MDCLTGIESYLVPVQHDKQAGKCNQLGQVQERNVTARAAERQLTWSHGISVIFPNIPLYRFPLGDKT